MVRIEKVGRDFLVFGILTLITTIVISYFEIPTEENFLNQAIKAYSGFLGNVTTAKQIGDSSIVIINILGSISLLTSLVCISLGIILLILGYALKSRKKKTNPMVNFIP